MLQILLSLIVLIAALVLLASSWRAEKRLFAATALVVSLTAAAMLTGLVYQALQPVPQLEPERVQVTLEGAHPMETGVRINGRLQNNGDARVAAVRLEVTARTCQVEPCEALGSDEVEVLLQVPPGGSYPFSTVARITGLRGRDDIDWTVTVLRVTTY